LIQFGYSESQAARALLRSNNEFNLALDLLQSETEDSEDSALDEGPNKLEKFVNQVHFLIPAIDLC
jgi:hypothetical protein